jgi:hypothetical protein
MDIGERHDQGSVVPEITRRGYLIEPFGQGLLSPAVRKRLREQNCPAHLSLMRWLPDRAVMVPGDNRRLGLIDAKTCLNGNQQTPYHAVEFRSILGALVTRIRSFYVCSDLHVLSAAELWSRLRPSAVAIELLDASTEIWPCCQSCYRIFRDGTDEMAITDALPAYCPALARKRNGGSGTPYVRFPRTWCHPLDAVFPPLTGAA